ncbi:MAG: histidine kinase [Bacteroidales bacterium]
MKDKYFYNSIGFRVAAPPVFGILIYLLILMFFDSLNMLFENFFSREVLFVIFLTYLFFEGNRLVILLNNKFFPLGTNIKFRIILQYLISIVASTLIISITLYYYFVSIEGFSTITTELLTFNSIYLITAIFYNLFFFSLIYLNRKNETKIEFEKRKSDNLNLELMAFKNQINPEFLFRSLEIVISELHRDKKKADVIIDQLSKIYRYALDNKSNDLITTKDEIRIMGYIINIFKYWYKNDLQANISVPQEMEERYLIPGTLQLILEYAISENLISDSLPLLFTVSTSEDFLIIHYPLRKKLTSCTHIENRIALLSKAYAFYLPAKSPIDFRAETDDLRVFTIPLIEIEEE